MNNHQIVKELPKLKEYKNKVRILNALINKYEKTVSKLENKLRFLRQVTKVINGVAVYIENGNSNCSPFYIRMVDENQFRRAEVYLNQHTQTTYCLNINGYSYSSYLNGHQMWQGGKAIGLRETYTLAKARKLAIEWVTKGTINGQRP